MQTLINSLKQPSIRVKALHVYNSLVQDTSTSNYLQSTPQVFSVLAWAYLLMYHCFDEI